MTVPSFVQLVTQVLRKADAPLSLEEILERVQRMRPVHTRNPRATIRGAIDNATLATTLGERPARYTWWPRHLADNSFRQPLSVSDLAAGTLAMNQEVWLALWPDFFDGSSRSASQVALLLSDGSELQTRIVHLAAGRSVWGVNATPELADWYRRQNATPDDELVVQVLDPDARRYALTLIHQADRRDEEIAARNRDLSAAAEAAMQTANKGLPPYWLIPRLIARDAYRHPLPPDPLEEVLRADLRFIVEPYDIYLTEKLVNSLEREQAVPPDLGASPRPRGDRHRARSDEARQAWGAYLFDRGMDHLWGGWTLAAEAYYREALRLDPGHADAWVHLGNRRFDEGRLDEALENYERGQAVARARTIGDPAHYPGHFWSDVVSRPFMRALHGKGLCLWRLGRLGAARQVFTRMLELNIHDNQGVRFLLQDMDEGLSWEESVARDEERLLGL